MCTAISYNTKNHYFGRTLDLEYSYNETVTITPRFFPFHFRHEGRIDYHYAMIGMATIENGYPLYYEATNENGLSMAGLNFPDNAHYFPKAKGKDNITPFEFIPWVLSKCGNLKEARELVKNVNLTDTPFSPKFPLSPIHWLISDKNGSITVESMANGLKIYDNPVGVLTNNPPFDYHLLHLSTFMNLSPKSAINRFSNKLELHSFCAGTAALGLPGDFSSPSRFVRAAFLKFNSPTDLEENDSVNQFFHIMSSVSMIKGAVKTKDGKDVITHYTSCCDCDRGIYYYTTYNNRQITAVDMKKENLDSTGIIKYNLM